MENKDKIDFLAVGDIVTEPFIRIKDASVHCKLNHDACELCLRFGDKVPYESAEIIRAVGNSANAAVCAARLGVTSHLMAYMGEDDIAKGNLEELLHNNVGTNFIQKVPGFKSNYHYVIWYDVERTILVNHIFYPYSFPENISAPKWMYLSSLASNSEQYHHEISRYLVKNPDVKLAFQPGTFQMKLGIDVLKDIYQHTEVFFCNVEEAQRILSIESHEPRILMDKLRDLGPKKVVVTDGIDGAYAFDGENYWFMQVYPHDPYERTGAGDAFCSTITSCLMKGKSMEEALLWAPINAMSVTQHVGAQKGLLTEAQIMEFLEKAPIDYKPVPLL